LSNDGKIERGTVNAKNVMIAVLAVAVVVLGYLYWDSQRTAVDINLPGVRIKAN
jgi:hypothetical protein